MMQVATKEDALVLDTLLTAAIRQLIPPGKQYQELPVRDRIGAMIVMKMVRHLSGNQFPQREKFLMAMTFALIGASTGITPKTNSSVDLLSQLQ